MGVPASLKLGQERMRASDREDVNLQRQRACVPEKDKKMNDLGPVFPINVK